MAHYAVLTPEMVVSMVFPGRDEDDTTGGVTDWEKYYGDYFGLRVVRTSYNTRGGVHYSKDEDNNAFPSADQSKAFRVNYAGVGSTFDETKGTDGAFIPPQPYPSWVLDEEGTCLWSAPVPMPEDGGYYRWDEEAGDWVAVPEDAVE